jgi:serpin B
VAPGGYPFRDEFLELVGRWYAAAVKVVDYIEAAEPARLAINTWVEQHTEGKIRDLVPVGGIDAMTRLVLVNAIYFYGTWVHQFNAASTRPGPFHLLDGQSREVPLMEQTDEFHYGEGDGWRAARLPYRGRASMLVVVPDGGRFAEVEARFGRDLLAEVREVLELRRLHLVLPRFELTCALELGEALRALGMVDLFDLMRADLTGMTAVRELFVSEVFHKAFVAVDERGTEAAAATAVVIQRTSLRIVPPAELIVDRPFLLAIEHQPSGAMLFLGRVFDPTA